MIISLDIGGTHLRIAGIEMKNGVEPVMRWHEVFDTPKDPEDVLTFISQSCEKNSVVDFEGLGISIAGVVDIAEKRLVQMPNLPQWNDFPLVSKIEKHLEGAPIQVLNDAAAAAFGEALFSLKSVQDFIFIIWGTGIGGAEVNYVDDVVTLTCFEPGHQIISLRGKKDSCGQSGCLESYVGGKSTVATEPKPEIIKRMVQGLTNIIVMRPTQLLVFGGGVVLHHPKVVKSLQTELNKQLKILPVPECRLTSLADNAGLFGAAAAVKYELVFS